MDAFDADVVIYAAVPAHPLGRRVRALFADEPIDQAEVVAGVGSVLLLPEVLAKPLRENQGEDVAVLAALLARLDLRPVDQATAQLAVAFAVAYGLRAMDAVHLATGVAAGADRFITNNRRDFPRGISEIDVTYPSQLAEPVT